MLDGITVLSQTVVEDANMALVLLPAATVALVCCAVCAFLDMNDAVSIIVSAVLYVAVAAVMYSIVKHPTDKYEYECVIDESVSMTEFCDRYKIIEQRGEIYVIREKDND